MNGKVVFGSTGKVIGTYMNIYNTISEQENLINSLENTLNNLNNNFTNKGYTNISKTHLPDGFKFAYSNLSDVSMYNVSKVNNLAFMFCNCTMTSLNTSGWQDLGASSYIYMFYNCKNLVDIDISNWYLYNIKNPSTALDYMFEYCNNLSNNSIDSIINMVVNIPVDFSNGSFNISQRIFLQTNITNDRYQNRWSELDILNIKY